MLNKKLRDKYAYYRHLSIKWMIIYMNLVLPAVCLLGINSTIHALFTPNGLTALFLLDVAFTLVQLICTFTIRAVDDIGYWVNIVMLGFWAVLLVIPVFYSEIPVFSAVASGLAILLWIIPNVVYFYKRRELFMKSVEELKQAYEPQVFRS